MEGSGVSQLAQFIKLYGYNRDVSIELGTITSPPPSIGLKTDSSPLVFDKDDVVIAHELTQYARSITIDGVVKTATFGAALKTGDRVIVLKAVGEGIETYYIIDKAVVY